MASKPSHPPIRFVIITLDGHIASAVDRAQARLQEELPGLELIMHAAADWSDDGTALEACIHDIERADIVFVNMLFIEDHVRAVLPALQARRDHCDAMIGAMSEGQIIKLTQMGGFRMDAPQKGPLALLKKLRGGKKPSGPGSGEKQMAMLKRLPKILRFIPGTAQDVRAYFLTLQYWLAGSEDNIANMVRYLVQRYGKGERSKLRSAVQAKPPIEYPETGIYHPDLPRGIGTELDALPQRKSKSGTVGLLVMRSYILSGDTRHYDAVIRSLEKLDLEVIPCFASGLDARPAINKFLIHEDGTPRIDALLSLTGFSLVGGPAFNDARAAEEVLVKLDVPYVSAQAIEFQTVEQWRDSERGLLPVESTIMLAIPELDGATGPMVFAGRSTEAASRDMVPIADRVEALSHRVSRLVELRNTPKRDRKAAIVLFNFPPNGGAAGTAAFLSVFASLHRVLRAMKADGYSVEVPESVDALRDAILGGNAERFGTDAHVHTRISVSDHVRREPHLEEIESQWGPAPGAQLTDGSSMFVLGRQFGNVLVGLQPGFGYEGDPMRLLFEKGFAPTHAFSAFYRHLREDFGANVLLHFGTHGALEFMPGKQTGLSAACWPDRLIGDVPHMYLYAANNPSEGTLAKRRAGATLISYMTPPLTRAGLYRGLLDLQGSLDRWRSLPPSDADERARLIPVIQAQASELELAPAEPEWTDDLAIEPLRVRLAELEDTLIPHGLHILGEPPSVQAQVDLLCACAEANNANVPRPMVEALVAGGSPRQVAASLGEDALEADLAKLDHIRRLMLEEHEIPAVLGALDARFIRPAPGGDLLRNPEILPTGRNVHGFDPFRIPSAFALADGERQTQRLIDRHRSDGHGLPESLAIVLWGTDNLKSEGAPIGQVLALVGARPRFDGYGRLCGAELIPLEELGRPRIDVVVTLSGIFRDLLPLQTRLLAEAFYLAATADEPESMNFVRRNALRHRDAHGCDLETAALRVFSNADGAYGSNVNLLVDSGAWSDEDELGDAYTRRKCYAYGRDGRPERNEELLRSALSGVQLSYQNLESVELGVTTIDHYFDTLGGIGRAVRQARGDDVPVYIGDQTRGDGTVRTLSEQVALESRTRMLNPKWYEGLLDHGAEGVRQIESHITNTMGWSATTGQVAPWVYDQLTHTFVLDEEMRKRLAQLNPKASAKLANRLIEAHERNYWEPDPSTLEALKRAGEELEDRLEGVGDVAA